MRKSAAGAFVGKCLVEYKTVESALLAIKWLGNVHRMAGSSVPLELVFEWRTERRSSFGTTAFPTRTATTISVPPSVSLSAPGPSSIAGTSAVLSSSSPHAALGQGVSPGRHLQMQPGVQMAARGTEYAVQGSGFVGALDPAGVFQAKAAEEVAAAYPAYYAGLPAGSPIVFIEYFTAEGTPYYYNTFTKETQWDRPKPPAQIMPAPTSKVESRQPSFFNTLNNMASGDKASRSYVDYYGSMGVEERAAGMQRLHISPTQRVAYVPSRVVGEDDLQTHFSQFGHLISTRIMVDKLTGRNKGYGTEDLERHRVRQLRQPPVRPQSRHRHERLHRPREKTQSRTQEKRHVTSHSPLSHAPVRAPNPCIFLLSSPLLPSPQP
jgi:hypothetical protein